MQMLQYSILHEIYIPNIQATQRKQQAIEIDTVWLYIFLLASDREMN